jgi:hypothetical protein
MIEHTYLESFHFLKRHVGLYKLYSIQKLFHVGLKLMRSRFGHAVLNTLAAWPVELATSITRSVRDLLQFLTKSQHILKVSGRPCVMHVMTLLAILKVKNAHI